MDKLLLMAKLDSMATSQVEKFFKLINDILPWVGFFLIGSWLFAMIGWGMDSTDTSARQRSGLGLHVDALTGCEYLSTPKGGITARLTATGQHMGCKP